MRPAYLAHYTLITGIGIKGIASVEQQPLSTQSLTYILWRLQMIMNFQHLNPTLSNLLLVNTNQPKSKALLRTSAFINTQSALSII